MRTIPDQLLAAMKRRGWSVKRLLDESGLKCDRSTLQRKLRGLSGIDHDEIQILVDTLGETVAVVPRALEAAA